MAEMTQQQRRAPWQPSPTDPTEPTLSARALAKARGTIEDFARSYMPLLGLPVDDVLCFADSLYFVAGSLYELDELNERGGDPSQAPAAAALRQFLAGRGLLDDVQATLDVGYQYWTLERRLINDWKQPIGDAAHEDALLRCACLASSIKSFDYSVLALLVARLTGGTVSKEMMLFLGACFQLVEIEDDLKDYRKDHEAGAFNIYAAFVRRYGAAAVIELPAWIAEREQFYIEARAVLTDEQLKFHVERNELQGGAGPAMAPKACSGGWALPTPILSERLYATT